MKPRSLHSSSTHPRIYEIMLLQLGDRHYIEIDSRREHGLELSKLGTVVPAKYSTAEVPSDVGAVIRPMRCGAGPS